MVPRKKTDKIDFFSDQACHNSKMHYFCTTTAEMSKKALNKVKTLNGNHIVAGKKVQ